MIDVETVLFIEKLNDLASKTKDGFISWSDLLDNAGNKIVYDDVHKDGKGYPVVIGDKQFGIVGTYDTEDSLFRVQFDENNHPHIIVSIVHTGDVFMICNGEWFSI